MSFHQIPHSNISFLFFMPHTYSYNSPFLNWIVALQALLTVFGNSTMAFAAYRVFEYENKRQNQAQSAELDKVEETSSTVLSTTIPPLEESNKDLGIKILITSLVASVAVKYGELFFDFAFDPAWYNALSIIAVSTIIHGSIYAVKSAKNSEILVSQ